MDSLSSSSTKMKKNKLSVRNKTRFKNTNSLLSRQNTIVKKALELSILCENDVCIIHYDREGNLVNTYPEDQCHVKNILQRYNSLSEKEKVKKNTNLSQFFNKKIVDEKRRALTDAEERKKFTEKVGEFKGSLLDQLRLLQDRASDLVYPHDHQPVQSPCLAAMSEQNLNFTASSDIFPNELSSSASLVEDPLWMNFSPHDLVGQQQETESLMNLLMTGDHDVSTSTYQNLMSHASSATDSSNHQSKFSVFVLKP